jgi:hypothetical protein
MFVDELENARDKLCEIIHINTGKKVELINWINHGNYLERKRSGRSRKPKPKMNEDLELEDQSDSMAEEYETSG